MNTPMHDRSPWMYYPVAQFPPLERDARTGACVVGGGIAGLTTAYLLAKKGRKVTLVTDGAIASGMSGRTTAHLSNAIDDRYYEIERLHGAEGARMAAASHGAAIDAIEAIAAHEHIECDFTRLDGFLFLPPQGDADELRAEHAAAIRAGVEGIEWAPRAPLAGFETGPCLRFPYQGQFHPVRYMAGLAQAIARMGGRIHCNTRVSAVEGGRHPRVSTDSGHAIECRDLVIATNAPIAMGESLHALLSARTTYAIAARVPRDAVPQALFWDTPVAYHYARLDQPGGELLLVGGEDHCTTRYQDPVARHAALERWVRARFPVAREIVHRWSGQVLETQDGLGLMGHVPGEDHVFVVTGDSGMGMTHATVGAIVVTDLIHGAEVPWAALYDPARASPQRPVARFLAENGADVRTSCRRPTSSATSRISGCSPQA